MATKTAKTETTGTDKFVMKVKRATLVSFITNVVKKKGADKASNAKLLGAMKVVVRNLTEHPDEENLQNIPEGPDKDFLVEILGNMDSVGAENLEFAVAGDKAETGSNGKAPAKGKGAKAEKAPAKKSGGKKAEKADSGPSNKFRVWQLWSKAKDKTTAQADKYHEAVEQEVKINTIRGWIGEWNRGNNFPAGANK